MAVVLNGAAGALLDRADAQHELQELFARNGIEAHFVPRDGSLPDRIGQACERKPDAVVVAGGDGTVACAAGMLAGTGIALGILPFGTMNLLAKDIGIPVGNLDAALAIVAAGRSRLIDVGEVNGAVFLCASMLGLPARLARHREAQRGHPERLRMWRRFAAAALRGLHRQLRLRMEVELDGEAIVMRAPSLTIAVNPLDGGGRLFARSSLDGGVLAVYVIERMGAVAVLRLGLRLLTGHWRQDEALRELRANSVTIRRRSGRFRVMNDGEVMLMASPLRYRIRPRALLVLSPDGEAVP